MRFLNSTWAESLAAERTDPLRNAYLGTHHYNQPPDCLCKCHLDTVGTFSDGFPRKRPGGDKQPPLSLAIFPKIRSRT